MMMTQIASDGKDSKLEHEIAFYNHLLSVVAKDSQQPSMVC